MVFGRVHYFGASPLCTLFTLFSDFNSVEIPQAVQFNDDSFNAGSKREINIYVRIDTYLCVDI